MLQIAVVIIQKLWIIKSIRVPYCIVDGGMHQMTYYGQMMAMKIPLLSPIKKRAGKCQIVHCHVSGSLCTMNDNLVKSLPLENPQIGDVLEFQRVGAYAMCRRYFTLFKS